MFNPSSPPGLWPQPPFSPPSLSSLLDQTSSPHSLQSVPLIQTPWLPIVNRKKAKKTLPSQPVPGPSAPHGLPAHTSAFFPLHLGGLSLPFCSAWKVPSWHLTCHVAVLGLGSSQHFVNCSIFQFPPRSLICIQSLPIDLEILTEQTIGCLFFHLNI